MDKFIVTRREWNVIRQRLPEGTKPEDAGFILYWSAEQVDLLMRLNDRWKTRR